MRLRPSPAAPLLRLALNLGPSPAADGSVHHLLHFIRWQGRNELSFSRGDVKSSEEEELQPTSSGN